MSPSEKSVPRSKMPFTLAALISGRPDRFPPTNPAGHRRLYFPPGGHAHDRHSIPPDQLHVSLSDPVLVAAEDRLSLPTTNADPGSVVSGRALSQRSGDINDANHLRMPSPGRSCKIARFRASTAHIPTLLDPSDEFDAAQVLTIISMIDGSPANTDDSASDNGQHGSDLAPLASETFREELYARGYLKRPASRPANVVPPKQRTGLKFMSRKVFPKVLGRRQGRKIAECLKVAQGAAETPGGPNAHLPEKHHLPPASPNSVTLQVSHAGGLESPGTDVNTSASETFDLHEFSYITAFTTPPSSPSVVLDAETFKKGATLGDAKHAV